MIFNKADFIASYGISSQLPESDRPELSFSGRSNVGKSSLINKLCSRKNLARVSSTPGQDGHHQLLFRGRLLFCGPAGLRLRQGQQRRPGTLG